MAAAEEGDIRTLVGTLSSLASAPLIAADRPNSFPTRRSVRRRSTMRSLAGSEEGSDALSRPSVAPRERERDRQRERERERDREREAGCCCFLPLSFLVASIVAAAAAAEHCLL